MKSYMLPSPLWAKRFARNARSRGYKVQVAGRVATVDHVDAQMRLLVQRYAGLPVKGGQR